MENEILKILPTFSIFNFSSLNSEVDNDALRFGTL